jgi:hypothetical protein
MNNYYVGYIKINNQTINLAVSNKEKKIKKYLKDVRGLKKDEYYIDELYMDEYSLQCNYEDYILEDWHGDLLPRRDIEFINKELYLRSAYIKDLIHELGSLYKLLDLCDELDKEANCIDNAIKTISNVLNSKKKKRKLLASIAISSPIYSYNILTYLDAMRINGDIIRDVSRYKYLLEKDE